MKRRKKILALVSCILATVFTFGVAGCGDEPSAYDPNDSYNPVGPSAPTESTETVAVQKATATEITNGYETGSSTATQTSEYLGAVDSIVKPVEGVRDEHETYGVTNYPQWGKNLKGYTVDERNGIIKESKALAPWPTWKSANIYDAIDSEGYLLRNGQRVRYTSSVSDSSEGDAAEGDVISGGLEEASGEDAESGSAGASSQYKGEYRMLYAHTASVGMYGGNVSDEEPRIIKKITAITRGGNGGRAGMAATQITGLYAPAGEVIKVQISEADMKAAGGSIRIYIGQNYNLDQHVSMETSGDGIKGSGFSRMSDILSIFQISASNATLEDGVYTAYVGSFLGGPIYFRANDSTNHAKTCTISVTISGGVKYQHFILGVTTPEEYEFNKNTTAPYFDLEVYDGAVRFTTTRYTSSGGLSLKDYTYENCTDAAILWDKITQVSKRVAANGLSNGSIPVNIIGDCYIAAGAAFANPGRNGVVCPPSWLAEALNYNKFVNGGCWGTMHEYNHCWQGYGFGNGGEVTNNATTLVAYSLYTRISQSRTAATGWNPGWNRFTDPAKSLAELLTIGKGGTKCFDLSVYATLLHNVGQDNFVTAAHGGREAASTVYYNQLVNATHYDMTYFVKDVLNYNVAETDAKGTIKQSAVDAVKAKNYPVFVPVASVYQVGRSITYDNEKQYITTAQPFSYGSGVFTMDLSNKNNFQNGSFVSKGLVIPDGFTVTVKNVTQPQNGKVELLDGNKVKYTPSNGDKGLNSGNFIVTLGITKNDGAFTVEDIDLVINLKQGTDTNLTRTTYVYDNASAVPATNEIYNAQSRTFDFGNYSSTEAKNNVCTQETNTQIWAAGRNYDDATYNKDSKNYRLMPDNRTLQTLEGVMYLEGAGAYRFTLKGRGKSTLYLSYDNGTTWQNALTINRTSGNAYNNSEYSEHEFSGANNYVYFKVVLLVTKESDFFGVGVASKKADGTFTDFANASAFTNPEVHKQVTAESAKKFETEYRFKNVYTYNYSLSEKVYAATMKLVSVSHEAWDNTRLIEFMFDGKADTWYHSKAGEANYITEAKPFELVVDFGSVKKVNSVTFNGYNGKIGNNGMVKSFKLYGSKDNVNYTLLTEVTDSPANAKNMTFNFDAAEIRYYKLVVTKTDNGRYFAMNSIVFSYNEAFPNGHHVAPNEKCVIYTGKNWSSKNVLCNFGLIYTAGVGDSVEFTFTGTRFAYLAYLATEYGTVDIYVDGNKIASDVSLSANKNVGSIAYMYTGDALSSGEHVVKIVGKSGAFNVDSFAYWD